MANCIEYIDENAIKVQFYATLQFSISVSDMSRQKPQNTFD